MAWISLMFAGLLEVARASGLQQTGRRFSLSLLVVTTLAVVLSLAALSWSMTRLPLGIACPVRTGIGSIGPVMASAIFFGHSLGFTAITGLILLVAGMILLGSATH